MLSDGKSFCGDVVFDSCYMVYTYNVEVSIYDQKYEKQICLDLYYEDFEF